MLCRCEGIYNAEQKRLAKMPRGTLRVKHNGKYYQFYRFFRGKEYGIKKRPELLEAMIQKKLIDSRLNYYGKMIAELKKLLCEVAPLCDESDKPVLDDVIFAATGLDRDKLYYTKEELAWMNAPYEKNTANPEHLIYKTKKGLLVRSKSEVKIAEFLDEHHIPYRYDAVLKINGVWVSPDFLIMKPDGSLLLWEHFGRDDKEYKEKNEKKIFNYFNAGHSLTSDFFFTVEADLLNMEAVEELFFYFYMR